MKSTEEIIAFIALRIGHIYHRPLMYGGTAYGVTMLANSILPGLLIVGLLALSYCVIGAFWLALRSIGSHLVDRCGARPSLVSAVASLIATGSMFLAFILVVAGSPGPAPPGQSRIPWPLLIASLLGSWHIARGIETLRNPPVPEWRPTWYRGPSRAEWVDRSKRKRVGRFGLSSLAIWVTVFCVLLGLGQFWIRQQESQIQNAILSHEAAVQRIEALGGLIQQGGHVSLANSDVRDADLEIIAGLRNLTALNLGVTDVTSDGLRHLTRLRSLTELTLSGTKVDDDGLRYLSSVRGLRVLNLRKTRITGTGFVNFQNQATGLYSMDLSLCPLTDEGLRALRGVQCNLLRLSGESLHDLNMATLKLLRVDTLEIVNATGGQVALDRLRDARPDLKVVFDEPTHE